MYVQYVCCMVTHTAARIWINRVKVANPAHGQLIQVVCVNKIEGRGAQRSNLIHCLTSVTCVVELLYILSEPIPDRLLYVVWCGKERRILIGQW